MHFATFGSISYHQSSLSFKPDHWDNQTSTIPTAIVIPFQQSVCEMGSWCCKLIHFNFQSILGCPWLAHSVHSWWVGKPSRKIWDRGPNGRLLRLGRQKIIWQSGQLLYCPTAFQQPFFWMLSSARKEEVVERSSWTKWRRGTTEIGKPPRSPIHIRPPMGQRPKYLRQASSVDFRLWSWHSGQSSRRRTRVARCSLISNEHTTCMSPCGLTIAVGIAFSPNWVTAGCNMSKPCLNNHLILLAQELIQPSFRQFTEHIWAWHLCLGSVPCVLSLHLVKALFRAIRWRLEIWWGLDIHDKPKSQLVQSWNIQDQELPSLPQPLQFQMQKPPGNVRNTRKTWYYLKRLCSCFAKLCTNSMIVWM